MSWSHAPWARRSARDSDPFLDIVTKSKNAPAIDESPVSITAKPFDNLPPRMRLDSPVTISLDSPVLLLPGINIDMYRMCALTAIAVVIVAPVASAAQLIFTLDLPWGVLAAGFCAQLVDGSLGMGYGITSATVLTTFAGLSPTSASSAVHLAQLGTTAVSGYSHRQCGNINDAALRRLTPPGVVGALLGSSLLSSLATKTSKVISGSVLLVVGAYVLFRFASQSSSAPSADGARTARRSAPSAAFLAPLGFVGGVVDALGGGGWGPVATSGLLAEGSLPPATAIGTVSLSEFFVTVAAVLGFVITLGPSHALGGGMRADLALMLLIGGLLAAPIAPHLVHRMAPRTLGMVVGAFICLTNMRVLRVFLH